jgi:hypothetical protein
MRTLLLCSIFCAGCFDYAGLSSQYDAAGGDGAIVFDAGNAADLERDGAISPDVDLAGADLVGADLSDAPDLVSSQDMSCAQHTHSNGLGQTWVDCVALGTYNSAQAMKACTASYPATSCKTIASGGDCYGKAIVYTGNYTYFVYAGTYQGQVVLPGGNCVVASNGTASWN